MQGLFTYRKLEQFSRKIFHRNINQKLCSNCFFFLNQKTESFLFSKFVLDIRKDVFQCFLCYNGIVFSNFFKGKTWFPLGQPRVHISQHPSPQNPSSFILHHSSLCLPSSFILQLCTRSEQSNSSIVAELSFTSSFIVHLCRLLLSSPLYPSTSHLQV